MVNMALYKTRNAAMDMIKIFQSDIEELKKGLDVDDWAQWTQDRLQGVTRTLEKNLKIYKVYGAYWWALKPLLNEAGFILGEIQNEEVAVNMSYESNADTVVAALAYSDTQYFGGALMLNDAHPMAYLDEDGEEQVFDFMLFDEELEMSMMGMSSLV